MLTAGRTVVMKWLHRIMSLAWVNGQVSEGWRRAVIVPVPKKGSKELPGHKPSQHPKQGLCEGTG